MMGPDQSDEGLKPSNEREQGGELAQGEDPNQVAKRWLKPGTPPEIVERVVQIQGMMSYSGPLPRPSDMAEYEEVFSGAADRIIGMAEKSLELKGHVMNLESGLQRRRVNAATMVSLALVGAGILAIIYDPAWLSIPLVTSGILTLTYRELVKVVRAWLESKRGD